MIIKYIERPIDDHRTNEAGILSHNHQTLIELIECTHRPTRTFVELLQQISNCISYQTNRDNHDM